MLPAEYRLRHDRDFATLFHEGMFVSGPRITAKIWPIQADKYPRRHYQPTDLRVGFVVGLKVSKSAVKRNRLKRQMREVVRLLIKQGKIKKGFLIALVAKTNCLGQPYAVIEQNIIELFYRAGLVHEEKKSP